MNGRAAKVLVIGLDCAPPRFLFGPAAFDLPHIQSLIRRGCWGALRSCDPPITVPAWASMMSGKDPGTLGVYGFRNRRDHSYAEMHTVNAGAIREPRLWDILSRHGKQVVVVGVPQTYPVRPVNGCMVSGMLTPGPDSAFTYPKNLRAELLSRFGEVLFDVKEFRTEQKDDLLKEIYRLMENRFDVAAYLMQSRPWDFFMVVEMGVDRLHHAFWRYCDPEHPKFEPGNRFESVFRDYYRRVDERIGQLLALAGPDTAVLLVSDHGARAMTGGFCVNQWLINQGYLALTETPDSPKRLEDCAIDWTRTTAWSTGGYYARIFLNVAGREPEGVVPPENYEQRVQSLKSQLEAETGPDGAPLGNRVLIPRDIYNHVRGVAPDLLLYAGDLSLRALGTVGVDDIFPSGNDTGPDDANHDLDGVFIFAGPEDRGGRKIHGLQLLDVAPTVLNYLDLPVPSDMQGRAIDV